MRLNWKGDDNVWQHLEDGFDIHCYEFQPSDFEDGIVVLSVDEAKQLSSLIDAVDCCADNFKLTDAERALWTNLNQRINEVEDIK